MSRLANIGVIPGQAKRRIQVLNQPLMVLLAHYISARIEQRNDHTYGGVRLDGAKREKRLTSSFIADDVLDGVGKTLQISREAKPAMV